MRHALRIILLVFLMYYLAGCASIRHFISPDAVYHQQKPAPIERVDTQQNQYYTVQEDDTLYTVSRKFNVTERALILWNNIPSPFLLKPGQVLKIFPANNNSDKATPYPEPTKITQNHTNNEAVFSLDDENLQDYSQTSETKTMENNNAKSPQKEQELVSIVEAQNQQKIETITEAQKTKPIIKQPTVSPQNKNIRQVINGQYTVQSGDSLLSIANSFDLTLSQIAKLNQIKPPYPIYVGQKLIVDKEKLPEQENNRSSVETESITEEKIVIEKKEQEKLKTPNPTTQQTQKNEHKPHSDKIAKSSNWQWPIPLTTEILEADTIVMLEGKNDQLIQAACTGKVIYAGIGVEGYGKMLIIDCGQDYITAYSNLKETLVQEGSTVSIGDNIGKLGKFNGQTLLGFEVRENGQPIKIKSVMPQ